MYCPERSTRSLKVDKGHYSTGGKPGARTMQKLCPAGYRCSGDGLAVPCGTQNDTKGELWFCPRGSEKAQRVRKGYFTSEGDANTRRTENICPAGYYCTGDGMTTPCEAGFFCEEGAAKKVPCEDKAMYCARWRATAACGVVTCQLQICSLYHMTRKLSFYTRQQSTACH